MQIAIKLPKEMPRENVASQVPPRYPVSMPQRRKASPKEIQALQAFDADLPEISVKDQNFIVHILAGESAAEAYRRSRPDSKSAPASIAALSSRLFRLPHIQQHLKAARLAGLQRMAKTAEGWLSEGERLKTIAEATGNVGASVAVWQTQGKAVGHLTDRIEHKHSLDDRALAAQLAAAGFGELAARVLQAETALQAQPVTIIDGQAVTIAPEAE